MAERQREVNEVSGDKHGIDGNKYGLGRSVIPGERSQTQKSKGACDHSLQTMFPSCFTLMLNIYNGRYLDSQGG